MFEVALQDVFLYYRSMADRKRLGIVQYLADHPEASVTDLGRELRLSQPLVSWHLSLLRRAGVVRTSKRGRQVFCSLDRERLQAYQMRVKSVLGLHESLDHGGDETDALIVQGASR